MFLNTIIANTVLMTTVLKTSVFDTINNVISFMVNYNNLDKYDIMIYNYDANTVRFTITRIEDSVLIFTGDLLSG